MKTVLACAAAATLLLNLVPGSTAGHTLVFVSTTVDGEEATGLASVPMEADERDPKTLVVITHGWGHDSGSHNQHLQTLAFHGYYGLAMDFRGSGFPLGAGAADTLAGIEWMEENYGEFDEYVLVSISMGTAVGAMVLAEKPGLFSRWFLSEPMANLAETWAEASAVCPFIAFACAPQEQIEAECGGTPVTAPECFRERIAVDRVPEIVGLQGAIVAHGVNDGLVPHNQGREIAAALRAHSVPTDFYTVLRGEAGGEGTTLTGHGGQNVDGFAGHGTESNDTHALTRVTWQLVFAWLGGALEPANLEFVVDRELGTAP